MNQLLEVHELDCPDCGSSLSQYAGDGGYCHECETVFHRCDSCDKIFDLHKVISPESALCDDCYKRQNNYSEIKRN